MYRLQVALSLSYFSTLTGYRDRFYHIGSTLASPGRAGGRGAAHGCTGSGARGARTRALVSTALEFGKWQALTTRGGLSDAEAAATMVASVETVLATNPKVER